MGLESWTPCQRPGVRVLQGNLATLEPLDWARHGQALFAAVGGNANADIWHYMPIGPFAEYESFRRTLDRSRSEQQWETMVILDAQGEVCGMASYMRIREAHGSVEIGCVAFGHRLQRTACATEAQKLMAAHVFDDLGYRRYEWKCNNANLASKRAAVRFGFAFEGLFRNDMVSKGESRDTAWYSIIDTEWRDVRAALDAWLLPGNFDSAGRQKKMLEDMRMQHRSRQTI